MAGKMMNPRTLMGKPHCADIWRCVVHAGRSVAQVPMLWAWSGSRHQNSRADTAACCNARENQHCCLLMQYPVKAHAGKASRA